jgi:hypothetical protein
MNALSQAHKLGVRGDRAACLYVWLVVCAGVQMDTLAATAAESGDVPPDSLVVLYFEMIREQAAGIAGEIS